MAEAPGSIHTLHRFSPISQLPPRPHLVARSSRLQRLRVLRAQKTHRPNIRLRRPLAFRCGHLFFDIFSVNLSSLLNSFHCSLKSPPHRAFFDFFSLLACRPQHVRDRVQHRKALKLFLWSLVLFYPVSAIFMIGVYLDFVSHPIGMILSILSFRFLWLSLLSPGGDEEAQPTSAT